MTHTPEPWEVLSVTDGISAIKRESSLPPSGCMTQWPAICGGAGLPNEANARRIVAAINATAGIPTEGLEAGVVRELVKALRDIADVLGATEDDDGEKPIWRAAFDALAKAGAQ